MKRIGFIRGLLGGAIGAALIVFLAPSGDGRSRVHQPSRAELALDRRIAEVNFDGVPFDAAIEWLGKVSGTAIEVDWPEFHHAGVVRNTRIRFRGRDLTLAEVLNVMLNNGPQGYMPVDCTPENGVVRIAPRGCLRGNARPFVRTYEVQDLIGADELPPLPRLPVSPSPQSGGGLFGGSGVPYQKTARDRGNELTGLLTELAPSDSWGASGGLAGSMRFIGDKLIVVQTWQGHRDVERFLADLRSARPDPPFPAGVSQMQVWAPRLNQWVSSSPQGARAALARTVPGVRLDHVTLEEAIETLGLAAHVDLVVDVDALSSAGFKRDARITLRLHDISLPGALDIVFASFDESPPLGYFLVGSAITVSTREKADQFPVTWVYDLRGLSSGGASGETKSAYLDRLGGEAGIVPFLQTLLSAHSWRDPHGADAFTRMRELNGRLIVTLTLRDQERLREILNAFLADPIPAGPATPASKPVQTAHADAVSDALDQVVPRAEFDRTPFDEAIRSLRRQTGAQLLFQNYRLGDADFNPKAPVTLREQNVPLREVLRSLISQANSRYTRLVVGEDHGWIVITSDDALGRYTRTRVYDVRDLIESALRVERQLQSARNPPNDFPPGPSVEEELTEVIRRAMSLASESDRASDSYFWCFAGRLVVVHTPEMQRRVADLLEKMRHVQDWRREPPTTTRPADTRPQ